MRALLHLAELKRPLHFISHPLPILNRPKGRNCRSQCCMCSVAELFCITNAMVAYLKVKNKHRPHTCILETAPTQLVWLIFFHHRHPLPLPLVPPPPSLPLPPPGPPLHIHPPFHPPLGSIIRLLACSLPSTSLKVMLSCISRYTLDFLPTIALDCQEPYLQQQQPPLLHRR
jgi:hypothetical protein